MTDFSPTWDEYIDYTFSLPNFFSLEWPDVVRERESHEGAETTLYWNVNFVIGAGLAAGAGGTFETFGGYMLFRGWAFRLAVARSVALATPIVAPLALLAVVGANIVEDVNPRYTMFETERQQRAQDQASSGSHYRW